MADITGNQTVRIRMPVATSAEIDTAKKKGVFGFDTTAGTVAVCPADGANFVRLGLHPADAPAATSLGGTDLVLIVQGGVLKRTTVADLSGGGVWQPLDADLTAIAALATTSFGRSLLTLADAAAARASIGAASSSDLAGYQPLDSDLTAIAALTTTPFGRSLLAMVDGPAVRAAIGAGTVEPADLASYQPLDSDLTAIAALATNAFGRGLLPLASAAAVRSYIGAGTSSFSGSYASLSSIPASIDAIDGLAPAADRIPYYTGASTGALTVLTAFARTLLDDADAATARTTLGAAATVHDHTAITGSAAKLTTARTIAATGDASWSVSFDGAANATATLTLANTITAAGPVGSATAVPIITYDAKGRLTAVSSTTITPAWVSVTGKPTTVSGYGIAATDVTAQLLSGFVAGSNTTIAATDSILAAFQKAQGQISARALASDVSTNYLTKANPTFTGLLTGPSATLTDFGKLAALVGDPNYAAVYGTGVTPSGSNYSLRFDDSGSNAVLNASTALALAIGGASKVGVTASEMNLASGVALKMSATTVIDSSRNGSLKSLAVDENIFLPNSVVWKSGSTNYFSMYASAMDWGLRDLSDVGAIVSYPLVVMRGVGGEIRIGYSGGLRPVRIGGALKNDNLAGSGTRPVVALADGTFDDQDAAMFRGTIGALAASLKGAANGLAELGADGRVPSGQLPSYVDDVLEYANLAAFPATGETGKIYINLDQNKTWRWSGSAYVEISASLALGETSATAYRGDLGKIAYNHSQATSNPHGTTAADVGAMPAPIQITGAINFNSINGGAPGIYRLEGSSYTNAPGGATSTTTYSLWQGVSGGRITQVLVDGWYGGMLHREQLGAYANNWSGWAEIWDSTVVPISLFAKSLLDDANATAARNTLNAAVKPSVDTQAGNWALGTSTPTGTRQTGSGTLTLPAASATYAGLSYTITATTSLTLTIAGSFCYLDATNSVSYWYTTETSTAFYMEGGHASGNRKKIEIWCDGQEWLVRC